MSESDQFGKVFLGKDRRESDKESNVVAASYPQHTDLKKKKKKVFFRVFLIRERLFSPNIGRALQTHLLFRVPVRGVRPAHPSRHTKKNKETFKIVSIHHHVSTPSLE